MSAVAGVYFRRLEVLGLDRFPARGAALLVANHPAAWTDALVLEVALRRELHFVAHEALFHPWIRGVFLKLFASLPVRYRYEGPLAAVLNRRTFDRCHALFHRGEAIAMFPEGVSGSDRGLGPFKPGAARLLVEHVAAGNPEPALIPVAIHYEDRTRFRTRVHLAVGDPVPIGGALLRAVEPEAVTVALTARMVRALQLALAVAASRARDDARPVGRPPPGRVRAGAGLVSGLAMVGVVLHAVPAAAIESVAVRLAGLPQQVSFGRMLAGVVLIPLWYGALVALAAALGGGVWFAIPAMAPVLGVLACLDVDRRRDREAATRTPAGEEHA